MAADGRAAVTLGEQLRRIRQRKELSLNAVASLAQISRAAVIRVEQDARDPKLSTVIGIARALEIEIIVGPDGVRIKEPV